MHTDGLSLRCIHRFSWSIQMLCKYPPVQLASRLRQKQQTVCLGSECKACFSLQKVKAMSLEHLVEKLAAFESQGDLPVVSLYLNAQADQHGRHNFLSFVRKQLPE